jgi:hypothetical protein
MFLDFFRIFFFRAGETDRVKFLVISSRNRPTLKLWGGSEPIKSLDWSYFNQTPNLAHLLFKKKKIGLTIKLAKLSPVLPFFRLLCQLQICRVL